MTDADLVDLIRRRRDASVKHQQDSHASDRKEALRFYRGDNDTCYGDSGNGLSTVVSRDTMEAIESILPGLIKPFVAGDEAVRFEPTQPDDEEGAKQATEYINYRFSNDNSAFRVVYDYAKDGLLFRLGVAKVVYEEVDESVVESLTGLDEMQYAALDAMIREDKQTEIVDDPIRDADGTISCKVKRQQTRGTYRVHIIAPEEFIYEDRLASIEDATFLGHKPTGGRAVGDLIAMGLDKKKCMDLQGLEAPALEAEDRFTRDEFQEQFDDDDLARKVTVGDYYIRCDYEGAGTLSWRRVVIAGNEDTILLNEPAEDHPFVPWTPIPIPHKLVGMSLHDMVRDIQMQKTALTREGLNALYLANRPQREVVEGQVNIEDLLNPSVGGVVRVKAPNMVREIPSGGEGVAQQAMQMIEYLDTTREQRTGSTRYNQGMDANSLNKTATGISIIQNASTQRLEMISRQLAEAMMSIFRKMLGLVSRYADKAEFIRLRGEFVQVDPREWRTGYDMSVAVGLGTGNKDQMAAHLTNLMQVQQQIAEAQQGMNGPIIYWENIYESFKRLVENLSLKGAERYATDPNKPKEDGQGQLPAPAQGVQQPQQPAPLDPMVELQEKNSLEMAKAKLDSETKITVAKIGAEKDIIIAGMQPPLNLTPDDMEPQPAHEAQEGPVEPPEPAFAPQGPFPGDFGGVEPQEQPDMGGGGM